MTITVKFFASLREDVGHNEIQINLDNPLTIEEVWAKACKKMPLPPHILIAINMQYVDKTAVVKTGDEIAFFPPVTGG